MNNIFSEQELKALNFVLVNSKEVNEALWSNQSDRSEIQNSIVELHKKIQSLVF